MRKKYSGSRLSGSGLVEIFRGMNVAELSVEQQDVKDRIIRLGVNACREFGYHSATMDNIITDKIYVMLFRSTLIDALGGSKEADAILQSIIDDIDAAKKLKEDVT